MFYVVLKGFEISGMRSVEFDHTHSDLFAIFNSMIKIIGLFVRMSAHIYLIRIALKMQILLRKSKLASGKSPDVLIICCYCFYCGYLFYWYLLKPSIRLLINVSPFVCDENLQEILAIFIIWQ